MRAVLLRLRFVAFLALYLPFCSLSYGYDALNGTYYIPDKDFDDKPGWDVGVNMPRKSCLTYTFFEDDTMLMLGADHSRGDLTYFAMMAGKKWKYVGDKMYAVEVYYDGNLSWAGKGFGVEVSSYKGVTIENLTADDVGGFARGDGLSLVVNGTTQARFSLDGALDAVHRLVACAIEVEAGRVPLDPTPSIIPSLDARNHPETAVAQANKSPRSEVPPTKPEAKREPAPQTTEEGREASSPAVRYDQGDNWHINIDKDARVCLMDLALGKQGMFIHFRASSSGDPAYDLTFEDNFPPKKKEYFYEIGGRDGVFSSGTAKAIAYKGRGYYLVDGLAASFLKDVALSDTLLVRFDAVAYGEYEVKDFRRGLGRFSDCVREFDLGSAQAPGKPSNLYDSGDDWSVYLDKSERTCGITLQYGSKGLILRSNPPGARTPYYLAFVRENWAPPEEEYEFELGNETQMTLSVKAQTFKNDTARFALVNGLKEDFLYFLVHSKVLRVEANGGSTARYDLSGFGHAFQRFSDCLKEVRDRKPSTPPKVRRMN